jgi:hypothetical protein
MSANTQQALRADLAARNRLIEEYLSLVASRVGKLLRRSPEMSYLRDDLIAAGDLAVCEAVQDLARREPVGADNPAAYLRRAIDNAIRTLASEDESLSASDRTQRRHLDGHRKLPKVKPAEPETLADMSIAPNRVSELREEILSCCEDDLDRMIVQLRECRYGDGEVAEIVNERAGKDIISRSGVQARRRRIFERFQKSHQPKETENEQDAI